MKEIIHNIKARIYGKRYNIYAEKLGKGKGENLLWAYYIYDDTIYFGCKLGVFIYSSQNNWHKDKTL